jgi:Protein of unknown function (DUF1345)
MSESGAPDEQAPSQPQPPGEPAAGGGPGTPGDQHDQGKPGHAGGLAGPHGSGHHLPDPWGELMHLADQVAAGRALGAVGAVIPAWRRRTRGERRWPVTLTVIAAIVLQVQLSDALTSPLPHWLMPALEGALLVALGIANPVRIERRGRVVRTAAIGLIVLISAANAVSAVLLIRAILNGLPATAHAAPLLASGANVWATNVIAFALWYWEFDRGGPVHRAEGTRQHPDLMFPQMASPELAPKDWQPYFVDYLYMSFTAATAFSPTDVMPLARWAKLTMAVQSSVSLAIGALVIARAVGLLH